VYYCQACDEPRLLALDGGVARCPACGNVDPDALIRPLFVVTGASGSGKTTILPELLSRMAGRCAVFDVDWLIDPLGRAAKDGQVNWSAFRDTWLHVAHGVAQNGLPTLLLAPFIPEHLDQLHGRAWVANIHYLVLDCPDDERRRRIEARPRWRARDIDEQTAFGRWLRQNLAPVIDTSSQSPSEVAEAVAAWVHAVVVNARAATGEGH
jgi:predicted ABC-type ATPase